MSDTKQTGSSVNIQNLQDHLDSASNALAKGQSQFFTPREFGKLCANPLPVVRPFICDLNCGRGDLLFATANAETSALLGSDIDPIQARRTTEDAKLPAVSKIDGDVTKLFPLLVETNFMCDLFALNPPWDLHWYRSNLADLADSTLPAVVQAFAKHDGRVPRDCIDSTVATLMMALDRMTHRGGGFLIANQATLHRLIFEKGAPHAALAAHIWANVSVRGNPMTGIDDCSFQKGQEFRTGVIWFSRGHWQGLNFVNHAAETMEQARAIFAQVDAIRHCRGYWPTKWYEANSDAPVVWGAVREEWQVRAGERKPEYNVWLDKEGRIRTYLTAFDKRTTKIDKKEVERLNALAGQRPMQLVMQASERAELNRAVNGGFWKVHPAIPEVVRQAIADYDCIRAPIFPLNKVQRLGYLDEEKFVVCTADLPSSSGDILFTAGKTYELESKSIPVERTRFKPSLGYGMEEYLLTGQELCFNVRSNAGELVSFVDARLLEEDVKIEIKPDFTMQHLIDHFKIPEVPDVAESFPEKFQDNMAALLRLEQLMNR